MSAEYTRGYRDGKDAGRMEALKEISARVPRAPRVALKRPPLPAERRCDCGHADVTHNELGYCQGKDKSEPRQYADQCPCTGFTNDHERAFFAERDAKEALVRSSHDSENA